MPLPPRAPRSLAPDAPSRGAPRAPLAVVGRDAALVAAGVAAVVLTTGGARSWSVAVVAAAASWVGTTAASLLRHRRPRSRRAAREHEEAVVAVTRQLAVVADDLSAEFPDSAALAELVRRRGGLLSLAPRDPGGAAWLVLGTGQVDVDVGVAGLGDDGRGGSASSGPADAALPDEPVTARRRSPGLSPSTIARGPLCVDARGGVDVHGPAVLVRGVAAGFRLQLRAQGGPVDAVAVVGEDAPSRAPAACVLVVDRDGTATVTRRDGRACRVPVQVWSISVHDDAERVRP